MKVEIIEAEAFRLYSHVGDNSTITIEYSAVYEGTQEKSTLMIFDRHSNLRYLRYEI